MIGRLSGTLVHEEPDGTVVLDVGGVGYELIVPAGTLGRARACSTIEGQITLWVHTHVREEALTLYGFCDISERSVFRVLLGISNVGPRTAVSLLSSIAGRDLARAVHNRDAGALRRVPGVGQKTAERLLLELRDKLPSFTEAPEASAGAASSTLGPAGVGASVVIDALTRLGFKRSEAERAVGTLGKSAETEPTEKSIRDALTILRR